MDTPWLQFGQIIPPLTHLLYLVPTLPITQAVNIECRMAVLSATANGVLQIITD
jgi:hypothetical protein